MQTHIEPLKPRWANLANAAKYSGMGVRMLENAVSSGILRSALVKSTPTAQRGLRLIDLRSLDEWIESYLGGKADVSHLVRTDRIQEVAP